ncbi:MAG TPA: tRNA-intron lyase [Thermoplasmata archaeon]|nr:tRNA-intron lyase [Thermoplasmata archaeon]
MTATVRADATLLIADRDEGATVYGRGFFGTPAPEGLVLDRFEGAYLLEMGRLAVANGRGTALTFPQLFRRANRAEPAFARRYLVYRDLRQRGYVVRSSPLPAVFSVLPRGGVLHKTPAKYWVDPISERIPFDLAKLSALADRVHGAKKTLLLAMVDEESDLTYYKVRRPNPTGTLAPVRLAAPAEGWFVGDRVTVFDPAAVEAFGRGLAYGSRVGDRLELSLLEAAHLISEAQLVLVDGRTGRRLAPEVLLQRARRLDRSFDARLRTYRTLRDQNLVVKTGFKYGAHFRAYPRNPEQVHARYLVHALAHDHVGAWPELAGRVRVAHGVRKEFLLAEVPPAGAVRYLSLERVRP